MLPLSSIFLLDFETVLAVWFFLFLILIFNYVLLSEVIPVIAIVVWLAILSTIIVPRFIFNLLR
jgi:hypothetical protein